MKRWHIISFAALSILLFGIRFVHKSVCRIPEESIINVWLQVNSDSCILISGNNTERLREQMAKRIRIPRLFDEKTMLVEGDYYIDVYCNNKTIHRYLVHDGNNMYDLQKDALYRCPCLNELRAILAGYVHDKYLSSSKPDEL